jgi:hypothetical protein
MNDNNTRRLSQNASIYVFKEIDSFLQAANVGYSDEEKCMRQMSVDADQLNQEGG